MARGTEYEWEEVRWAAQGKYAEEVATALEKVDRLTAGLKTEEELGRMAEKLAESEPGWKATDFLPSTWKGRKGVVLLGLLLCGPTTGTSTVAGHHHVISMYIQENSLWIRSTRIIFPTSAVLEG